MSLSGPTQADVLGALQHLADPEIGRPLSELKMLAGASVAEDGTVEVRILLPTPAYPRRERLTAAVQAALAAKFPGWKPARVEFDWKVRGRQSGARIGLHVQNTIAVGSGKGGVGKSTIAAALAYGLKQYGAQVGLLDADVYGPSIPHMVGAVGKQPAMIERRNTDGTLIQRIQPVEVDSLKLMSIGLLIQADQAVIWRGPMLHKLLTQFLQQTDWGELDYLIIDLPPGTGDVSLTLSQLLGLAGAVVVCTPQKVALLDAVKAISMFRQVKIPVVGIVENMSGDIFGRGGARQKAAELGVPFLGEVPTEPRIRIETDEGRIAALFAEDSPAREPLLNVCEQTAIEIARQFLRSGQAEMPTLEIL